jgi:Flp pilus assembly pilin Flp
MSWQTPFVGGTVLTSVYTCKQECFQTETQWASQKLCFCRSGVVLHCNLFTPKELRKRITRFHWLEKLLHLAQGLLLLATATERNRPVDLGQVGADLRRSRVHSLIPLNTIREERTMRSVLLCLWRDDSGALLSFEWILLATILVLAMVVGLKSVQQAVLNEFEDLAAAIGEINQTYNYGGASGCCALVGGSAFTDVGRTYNVDSCVPGGHALTLNCQD